jgi:chitinase
MKSTAQCLRYVVVAVAAAATACATHQTETLVPLGSSRIVGYYFGPTATRGFRPSAIKGAQLTHINYAFAQIMPDGSAALGNPAVDAKNFRELQRLKRRYPHLKVLIAFGGWGGSRYFSEAAATPESRARFVATALELFFDQQPGVFDGIDLDWEYPMGGGLPSNITRPEDRENLTELVSELRRAFDERSAQTGNDYLISAATPAGRAHLRKYEMGELAGLLDFINVMTYDYHTAGKIAHFNAPLSSAADDPTPEYNILTTVEAYRAAGVPADKLVIGVPFYGYGYGGVGAQDHGRFQPAARNGFEDTAVAGAKPKWAGAVRFHQIAAAMREGFIRHFDEAARVPWLYHPISRVWITYDDAQSIGEKADYVRTNKLGGIMIWELSGDKGKLLPLINQRLRSSPGEN